MAKELKKTAGTPKVKKETPAGQTPKTKAPAKTKKEEAPKLDKPTNRTTLSLIGRLVDNEPHVGKLPPIGAYIKSEAKAERYREVAKLAEEGKIQLPTGNTAFGINQWLPKGV